jgi:hypothetical protein
MTLRPLFFVFLLLVANLIACTPATDSPDAPTAIAEVIPTVMVEVAPTEEAEDDGNAGEESPPADTESTTDPATDSGVSYAGVSLELPYALPLLDSQELEGIGVTASYSSTAEMVIPRVEPYREILRKTDMTVLEIVEDDGSFILSGQSDVAEAIIIYGRATGVLSLTLVDTVAFRQAHQRSLFDAVTDNRYGEIGEITFDGVTYKIPPYTEGLTYSDMGDDGQTGTAFGTNSVLSADDVYQFMAAEMLAHGYTEVIEHNLPTSEMPFLIIEWVGPRHNASLQFGTEDGTFNLTLNKN